MVCPVCGKQVEQPAVDGVQYCNFHGRMARAILRIPALNQPPYDKVALVSKVIRWAPQVEQLWRKKHPASY